MPTLTEKIRATIQGYFDAYDSGSVEAILALLDDDVAIEDPVGSEVLRGAAVRELYERAVALKVKLVATGPFRIAGHEAAFPLRGTAVLESGPIEYEVIDVMVFNEHGRIKSMRAFFGPENVRPDSNRSRCSGASE
jgi:steroid delta-isomerase